MLRLTATRSWLRTTRSIAAQRSRSKASYSLCELRWSATRAPVSVSALSSKASIHTTFSYATSEMHAAPEEAAGGSDGRSAVGAIKKETDLPLRAMSSRPLVCGYTRC